MAAARKGPAAGRRRGRAHFQRNLLPCAGETGKPVDSAVVTTVFAVKHRSKAHARWRELADSLRGPAGVVDVIARAISAAILEAASQ